MRVRDHRKASAMETTKPTPSPTQLSDGWVTKEDVLKLTGVSSWQLRRWHRKVLMGASNPLIRRPGMGRGTTTLYHSDCIAIVRRVLEMKEVGPHKFEEWRWQLWLEGYPVSIREDCIKAIEKVQKEISSQTGQDTLEIVETLIGQTGTPLPGSLSQRIYKNIPSTSDRHSLQVWSLHTTIGQEPLVGWHSVVDVDPDDPPELILNTQAGLEISPENRHYPTIGELFTQGLGVPRELAKSAPPTEWMSVDAFRKSLEQATEDEWRQAREACRFMVGTVPLIQWHIDYVRAAFIGILMEMMRSEMKGNLEAFVADLAPLNADSLKRER
jgi:hypothetical protein